MRSEELFLALVALYGPFRASRVQERPNKTGEDEKRQGTNFVFAEGGADVDDVARGEEHGGRVYESVGGIEVGER